MREWEGEKMRNEGGDMEKERVGDFDYQNALISHVSYLVAKSTTI